MRAGFLRFLRVTETSSECRKPLCFSFTSADKCASFISSSTSENAACISFREAVSLEGRVFGGRLGTNRISLCERAFAVSVVSRCLGVDRFCVAFFLAAFFFMLATFLCFATWRFALFSWTVGFELSLPDTFLFRLVGELLFCPERPRVPDSCRRCRPVSALFSDVGVFCWARDGS